MRGLFLTAFTLILCVPALMAQRATVISFPHQGHPAPQSSTYQGVGIAGMSVALQSSAQPCLTGVPTCPPAIAGGLSLAFPRYYLQSSQENSVTVVVEDTDYTGSCAAEVVANSTSGALAGEYDLEYCQPNTDYIFNFLLQLPSPGSPAWKPISVNAGLILSSDRNGTIVSGATVPAILGLDGSVPFPTIIGTASVSIGAQTAGLPCSNCGPAVLKPGLSIPVPMYVVPRDQPLTVTLVTENINYTGPCSFEYAVKQEATTVIGGTRSVPGGCFTPPGTGYTTVWGANLPEATSPGPAVLVGAVVAGSNTYSIFQQILIQ